MADPENPVDEQSTEVQENQTRRAMIYDGPIYWIIDGVYDTDGTDIDWLNM